MTPQQPEGTQRQAAFADVGSEAIPVSSGRILSRKASSFSDRGDEVVEAPQAARRVSKTKNRRYMAAMELDVDVDAVGQTTTVMSCVTNIVLYCIVCTVGYSSTGMWLLRVHVKQE